MCGPVRPCESGAITAGNQDTPLAILIRKGHAPVLIRNLGASFKSRGACAAA
jgi:hypothetical protein